MKTRDPGIENEVTNSETLNSETFFSQGFCKVPSFPLVLDLIHKCYVISFPDVFHFLIRSSCFAMYFHISTTVFSLLNALGVYIFFLILGWASIGEGRLFKKLDFLSNSLLSLGAIQ